MSCVGKTVCVVARASAPPTFIAAAADRDNAVVGAQAPPQAPTVIEFPQNG